VIVQETLGEALAALRDVTGIAPNQAVKRNRRSNGTSVLSSIDEVSVE
jgi:hypothetical protein